MGKSSERIKTLELVVQQLQQAQNETRVAVEQLARITGLEYSQDLRDWVAKDKLDALRKEPRESKTTGL